MARSVLFLYAYLARCSDVDIHGADHTGRDHGRFVDREGGTKSFLPGPVPSLLFLVYSLGLQDLTILSPPLTIPLGLKFPHAPFSTHGFSVPSGTFDREQVKTERHAPEWCTPGSAKDHPTADSGQVLKRPSIPYQKKGQRPLSQAFCHPRLHFYAISAPSEWYERF